MSELFLLLLLAAVLAYALVGGVFLAFSDFIMRSLSLSTGGAGAMQRINEEVFRWVFMALFLGLAPLSVAIALYALMAIGGTAGALLGAAGLVYMIGVFGVTVLRNVPMNSALARLDTGTAEAQAYWMGVYVPRWTFWNSVRAAACILSAVLGLLGMLSWVRTLS